MDRSYGVDPRRIKQQFRKNDYELELYPEKKNVIRNFILYLGFLIMLALILYYVKKTYTTKIFDFSPRTKEMLPYMYMFSYAIIAGVIIYYGIENFDSFLQLYTPINNKALINLISVSVVAAFCYYYVGSSKDLLEKISGHHIQFNTNKNVIGFVVGRILIIITMFILLKFFEKNNNNDKKKYA